jgi:hypothetical protein
LHKNNQKIRIVRNFPFTVFRVDYIDRMKTFFVSKDFERKKTFIFAFNTFC